MNRHADSSGQPKVAIIAPRDVHCSRTCHIPIRVFSRKYSIECFVPTLMQRLKRFRRMLITRSDDGYFGRNHETWLVEASFKLEEVWCVQ